jgi:enamine deaminase RidA (YjgF/YER057c/UK114 family)
MKSAFVSFVWKSVKLFLVILMTLYVNQLYQSSSTQDTLKHMAEVTQEALDAMHDEYDNQMLFISGQRERIIQLESKVSTLEKELQIAKHEVEQSRIIIQNKDKVIKTALVPESNMRDAFHNHVVVPSSHASHEARDKVAEIYSNAVDYVKSSVK